MILGLLCVLLITLVGVLVYTFMASKTEAFVDEQSERVVISLTTSPKRIHLMESTIRSITNDQSRKPDLVYLNIPERFGRTNEPYTIPDFLQNYPLVRVNRVEKDEGPITKLTPAVRAEKDPNTIIIILDDDIVYDVNLVSDLLRESHNHPGVCIANVCADDFLQINPRVPSPNCEILEGWGAVLFRRSMFSSDFEEYLSTVLDYDRCFTSDDYTIGNYLSKHGIKQICVNKSPRVLDSGRGNDALSALDMKDRPITQRYVPCKNYMKEKNMFYFQHD